MKKIWFDITNTPQVHFLLGIKDCLKDKPFSYLFTSREFSETSELLKQKIGSNYQLFGNHYGKNRIKKVFSTVLRFVALSVKVKNHDISISCVSDSAIWGSWLKRKKIIVF